VSVIYVGIDVGKRKHEASLLDETSKQLGSSLVFNNSPKGVEKLLHRVATLGEQIPHFIYTQKTGVTKVLKAQRRVPSAWEACKTVPVSVRVVN